MADTQVEAKALSAEAGAAGAGDKGEAGTVVAPNVFDICEWRVAQGWRVDCGRGSKAQGCVPCVVWAWARLPVLLSPASHEPWTHDIFRAFTYPPCPSSPCPADEKFDDMGLKEDLLVSAMPRGRP